MQQLHDELELVAKMGDALKQHFPLPEGGGVRCACGLGFPPISATAWHRHAAAMVANVIAAATATTTESLPQAAPAGLTVCGGDYGSITPEAREELRQYAEWLKVPKKERGTFNGWRMVKGYVPDTSVSERP